MKRYCIIVIIAVLTPHFIMGQSYEVNRSGGETKVKGEVNGLGGEYSINDKDIFNEEIESPQRRQHTKDDSHERDHYRDDTPSEYYYSGISNDDSWGENELNDLYEDKIDMLEIEDDIAKDNAHSCFDEMVQLLSEDCIDVYKLKHAITRYCFLSNYQRDLLGEKGKNTFTSLTKQLQNKSNLYLEYSIMAANIRNLHFENVDQEAMKLSYEDAHNKYLIQFLNKEDFEKAKIEYVKYENAKIVKDALTKIRNHKFQPKEHTQGDSGCHLALQQVRNSMIDNYKVGEMMVKDMAEGQELLGNAYIPKSLLLEQLNKGINSINKAKNIKGIFVNSFSGNWEEASSGYMKTAKEKLIDPLKDCVVGLGSSFTVSYNTAKRIFNFNETYSTIMNDTWEGIKDAIQAGIRGENPEKYIRRTIQKDLKTEKDYFNNYR